MPRPYNPANGGQNFDNFAPGGYYNPTGFTGSVGLVPGENPATTAYKNSGQYPRDNPRMRPRDAYGNPIIRGVIRDPNQPFRRATPPALVQEYFNTLPNRLQTPFMPRMGPNRPINGGSGFSFPGTPRPTGTPGVGNWGGTNRLSQWAGNELAALMRGNLANQPRTPSSFRARPPEDWM